MQECLGLTNVVCSSDVKQCSDILFLGRRNRELGLIRLIIDGECGFKVTKINSEF